MPQVEYDPNLTLRDARARYFEANGLGEGGYEDRWVIVRALGIPVGAFPNTPEHVRSIRLHDAHHVLTGYDTSWVGEAEIGAWELASGCADHVAAWILNAMIVVIGVLIAPRSIWRAAKRGRRSRNLYEGEWDEAFLDRRVSDLRRQLALD